MNAPNTESQRERYLSAEGYLATRENYDKAEVEVSGRYDKWILTLAGGALALSLTFLEKIAQHPKVETLYLLKLSWGGLVLSLLGGLISLLTSQSAIREQRKELDEAYEKQRAPHYVHRRWFTTMTNLLNWGSAILFVSGVALLCVFTWCNLPSEGR